MTRTVNAPFAVIAATFLLLCGALFTPAIASAVTVSGSVTTSAGAAPVHPVTVDLYWWDNADWQPSDYSSETLGGAWSIDVADADASKQYKAVFSDWPYNWYAETVHPNARLDASGLPSNGETITPGAGSINLVTMMDLLPLSYTGTVSDKAGNPLEGITVSAYVGTDPENDSVASTETAADGTYELHGLTEPSYRIGFDDYNGAYASTFYNAKSTLGAANVVNLGASAVNATMTRYVAVERVAPTSGKFWTQSVNVARRQYVDDLTQPWNATTNPDAWDDVTDIVITSGDTRAQSDPLAAAGLCWAYQVANPDSYNANFNAPLLLVSASAKTDPAVLSLVKEIGLNNAGLSGSRQRLTIHIVGGPVAVPDARFNEISAALVSVGAEAPIKDRVLSTGGRYDLAEKISQIMKSRADASADDELVLADFALIANGADPASFYDSLAFSPVSASVGAPILLVTKTSVPKQTSRAIGRLKVAPAGMDPVKSLYVGGGTAAVSSGVFNTLKASTSSTSRVYGSDRYKTARAIADKAVAMGWLRADSTVAIASTIADAQLGGVLAGNDASPLLLTAPTSLTTTSKSWLTGKKTSLLRVYLVGSTSALNTTVYNSTKAAVAN